MSRTCATPLRWERTRPGSPSGKASSGSWRAADRPSRGSAPTRTTVVGPDPGRERPSRRRGGPGSRLGDQPVRRDDLAHRPEPWQGRKDDPGRARSPWDRGRVRQRVGSAGRVEPGCAHRPCHERSDHPIGVGNAPGSLAVSEEGVWVVNTLDDTVIADQPRHERPSRTRSQSETAPPESRSWNGIVWVANEADGTLSRIEPGQTPVRRDSRSGAPRRGSPPLTATCGSPCAERQPRIAEERFDWFRSSRLRRSTLGSTTIPCANRLLHLLGDGLVAFEPVGGTNPTLVADLATSIPAPTDDSERTPSSCARTSEYSNGEVVAPLDFRLALEQGFPLDGGRLTSPYTPGSSGARPAGRSLEPVTSPRASRPTT